MELWNKYGTVKKYDYDHSGKLKNAKNKNRDGVQKHHLCFSVNNKSQSASDECKLQIILDLFVQVELKYRDIFNPGNTS